jgi:hypothetical protein
MIAGAPAVEVFEDGVDPNYLINKAPKVLDEIED